MGANNKTHKNNFLKFLLLEEESFFKKFSIFIIMLVIILFPFFTHSAKASTTVTTDNTSSGGTSWQHTTGNNANTILIVGVNAHITTGGISSVSYDGVALTQITSVNYQFGNFAQSMWYLKNPHAGTHTVTITGTANAIIGGAATFYNVDLTNSPGTSAQNSGNAFGSTNITINATTSQLIVDATGWATSNAGVSPGGGQTVLWQQLFNGNPIMSIGGSSKVGTGGNTSMSWGPITGVWGGIAVVLNSAPVPTPTTTPTFTQTPTPTITPTPTLTPTLTPTPTPIPASGNITGLNFGVTNATSWIQSICGDVRQDSGISNPIPPAPTCGTYSGPYMIQPDGNICTGSPGIAFTGNANANFGQGQASADPTNWIVGGSNNPEKFKPKTASDIKTSYTAMNAKVRQSGLTPVDLATKCSLNSCTITAFPHGLYQTNPAAPTDLHIQTSNLSGNQNYVFLVSGNLYIDGPITIAQGSTATFSVAGNIYVGQTVGNATSSDTTADVEGFYSTDKSFIINTSGTCPDLRLNISGSIVVNAALQGGALQNNRTLCGSNASCPTVSFTQRPDLLLNAPLLIKNTNHVWQEVAP